MLFKTAILFTLLFIAVQLNAEERYSFGVGTGTAYTGLGVNFGHISETDMKYVSAGCFSYSTRSRYTCGGGVGWIRTDLFGFQSNKHGFGAYLGTVGTERRLYDDDKAANGLALSYNFFLRGIDKPSFNFGVSYVFSKDSDSGRALFQAGYQF